MIAAGGKTSLSPEVVGPSPCDGCENRERCAAYELACRAFTMFVNEFRNGERWSRASKRPNRVTYLRIYSEPPKPAKRVLTGRARLKAMARTLRGGSNE